MQGQVLTIAQQKGGAGKTTLAAQLAAAFSTLGYATGTVDIDPQGSLSLWFEARQTHLGDDNRITHSQISAWRLKAEIDRLKHEMDVIVIDSPPHADSDSKIAVRMADLVLVPVQPSPMDIWASKPTFYLAESEGSPLQVVLNRMDTRTNLTGKMLEKLDLLNVKVADQSLGSRVAFASSMLDGLGVVESEPSSPAAKEINALARILIQQQSFKKSSKAA